MSAAPASGPAATLSVPRGLLDAAAGALDALSHEVEGMGVELCADPDIALRHLDQLQAIDRVAQSLAQLALVLRAPRPEAAIDNVRMGDLQARLREAQNA